MMHFGYHWYSTYYSNINYSDEMFLKQYSIHSNLLQFLSFQDYMVKKCCYH